MSNREITIRRCRRQDAQAVLELWAQARSGHASTVDRLDDVERLIADSPAALLVAERDGGVVGALIAAWDGWRGNMYRLAVSERHRRAGVGIALTRAGEEYLRSCGARRVTALVAFEDDAAGAFWEAAGYSGPLHRPPSPQSVSHGQARRPNRKRPAGEARRFWGYYREERYVSLYMLIRGR